MEADLSFFDGAQESSSDGPTAVPGPHFLTSAVAVTVARAATSLVMAVPVATFAAAVTTEPVFQNSAFHWVYSIQHEGASFQADLSGRLAGGDGVWEMRITTTGTAPALTDFRWYTGRSAGNGSEGEWHVFDATQPSSAIEVLQIDWAHPTPTSWNLVFTNVNPSGGQTDDRLEYEVAGDLRIVRYIDASASTTAIIQWDASTGEGFVESPGYNGGQRGCWNALFEDTPCV